MSFTAHQPLFAPLSLLAVLLFSGPLLAQNWAASMVKKTLHDFGTVARGSDAVYRFAIKNSFTEDMLLKSVTSSCGCTSASLDKKVLKTYETGHVVAKFNTRTFKGQHAATLTVHLEYRDNRGVLRQGQLLLRVRGFIRGDVVFEPGSINFGAVEQGQLAKKSLLVTRAGRPGWQIQDVRSTSTDLEVDLVQRRRTNRDVAYEILVRLRDSAAVGPVNQQLILVTNEGPSSRILLDVSGDVKPQISVAPATLVFGEAPVGKAIVKRVIVRSGKPFRITEVQCGDDGCFRVSGGGIGAKGAAKDRHILQVTFQAKRVGPVQRNLVFKTDLGDTYTASCTAYATVVAPAGDPAAHVSPPSTEKQLAKEG